MRAPRHISPTRMWRGVAFYRAGRFAEAIDAFAQVDTAESYYNQGNALCISTSSTKRWPPTSEALKLRPDWPEAKANLAIAEKLIADRKDEEDEQEAGRPTSNLTRSSSTTRARRARRARSTLAQQTADMWMRNIQVTPTDLLARRFALEAAAGAKR